MTWHTTIPSNHPKFMVKGTELATLVCGQYSRFQICEHRCYDIAGFADRNYAVRDAQTVTDAEVKQGIRPKIIARFNTLEEAEKFVKSFTDRQS